MIPNRIFLNTREKPLTYWVNYRFIKKGEFQVQFQIPCYDLELTKSVVESLKDRVKRIILERCKGSNKTFAETVSINASTINTWDDEHLPKGDILTRIHESFRVNLNWLLIGEGSPYIEKTEDVQKTIGELEQASETAVAHHGDPLKRPKTLSEILIPKTEACDPSYFDLVPMAEAHLSGGGGAFVQSEKMKQFYAFRKDWLRRVATSPKRVVLMAIHGNSMEPTILDGDVVMLDTGRTRIFDGKIYALGQSDTIMIKRLENLVGGRVRIISDNRQEFPAYEVNAWDLRIIGQVIWSARELVARD